ncbi:MAG: DUF4870 domain-containing protein [Deltaproteobacteria bacterium]|nr:DUF4870 domain-containing protein [Deltaproteobacteria bacterium]
MDREGYRPLPQPSDLTEREKEDAMGSYLMMFAAWGVGLPLPLVNVLAAVIYYFVNRGKGPFVKFHAHQSMTSQIMVGLLNAGVVFGVLRIVFWEYEVSRYYIAYVITAVVINVAYFVFSILAAVRARKGRFLYMWFFGKLAYHFTFFMSGRGDVDSEVINAPPKGM